MGDLSVESCEQNCKDKVTRFRSVTYVRFPASRGLSRRGKNERIARVISKYSRATLNWLPYHHITIPLNI